MGDLFPEWVMQSVAESLDPAEGYFTERARQRALTDALGQVTCESGHAVLPCDQCGAAV